MGSGGGAAAAAARAVYRPSQGSCSAWADPSSRALPALRVRVGATPAEPGITRRGGWAKALHCVSIRPLPVSTQPTLTPVCRANPLRFEAAVPLRDPSATRLRDFPALAALARLLQPAVGSACNPGLLNVDVRRVEGDEVGPVAGSDVAKCLAETQEGGRLGRG